MVDIIEWFWSLGPYKNMYIDAESKISELNKQVMELSKMNVELSAEVKAADVRISELENQINQITDMSYYEKKYHDKYPITTILYAARPIPKQTGNAAIDVRTFFSNNDSMVSDIVDSLGLTTATDNEKAIACLKWIITYIKYTPDSTALGYTEYWQFPFETIKMKHGDCEDGSILLANLMLASGIKYWKIRLSAGNVDDGKGNAGGHCFVTYFDEDTHKWVLLDWCFYANLLKISERKDYKDETYYKDVWFSWNQRYAYSNEGGTKIVSGVNVKKKRCKKKCQ